MREQNRKELERRQARKRRRQRRRRRVFVSRLIVLTVLLVILGLLVFGLVKLGSYIFGLDKKEPAVYTMAEQKLIEKNGSPKPYITEDFLTPNEYSRPGDELTEINNIFVHYTANAGTSASQNRSYFENLGITGETSASAHFIIGYDGEIIQCLPLDEIGYAVKEHNFDSVSIECCYLSDDGSFTDATYNSLIELLGWLLKEYELAPSDVLRHYDAGGKLCPKYYAEDENAWEELLTDLEEYIYKF